MVNQPPINYESFRLLTNYNDQQQQGHLQLLQYSNAYFNPYEVKHRKRTSRSQLLVLEATFNENSKPSSAVKKALSAKLDMPLRNVQVWFQNRRAKDKHLANKARNKAETGGQDGPSCGDDDFRDSDDEKDASQQLRPQPHSPPKHASGSNSGSSSRHLVPPTVNLNLRRGSAPSLGLSPVSEDARFSPPQQSPLGKHRIASESTRPVNGNSNQDDLYNQARPEVPIASILGRRRSLPAFHPDNQQCSQKASQISTLPTITDYVPSSQGEADPTQSSGHGGVYRSGAVNPKYGAAPYPLRGPMSYNYRSGSMPGTGVFRVPTNPLITTTQPWVNGGNEDGALDNNVEEGGSMNGNRYTTNTAQPAGNHPYSFPPRRVVPDQLNPGPLPREDFSFGDNNANAVPTTSSYQDDDTTENEASRMAGLTQSYRFGSFASDYSIESDATGTTNTTTTSSVFGPMANILYPSGAGYRAARFGLMQGLGFQQNNYDAGTGPPISYGTGGGGSGMSGGLSAGPVNFPNGFHPDMRRASCPAHFVDQFASFGVHNPSGGAPPFSFNNRLQPATIQNHNPLRKMSSPGLTVQVNGRIPQSHQLEENEPLTAIVAAYMNNSTNLPTIQTQSPTDRTPPTASMGYPSSSSSPPEIGTGTGTGQSSRSHSLNPNQSSSRETTQSPIASMHTTPIKAQHQQQYQHHGFLHSTSGSPQDVGNTEFSLPNNVNQQQQQHQGEDFLSGVPLNDGYQTTPEAVNGSSPYGFQHANTSTSSIYDWNHHSGSHTHLPLTANTSTNNSQDHYHTTTNYPVYGSQENVGGSTSSFSSSYDGGSNNTNGILADGVVGGGYHFDQAQIYGGDHNHSSNSMSFVGLDAFGAGGAPGTQPTFLHAPAPILPPATSLNYAVHLNNASSEAIPH
ncbi:hypothetical protein FRB94_000462 [Tulasnella sp. JGI-2019a]|nr:hypothetical protein FRB94_000462 [Tulasnella sp. JGI-2019a]KAG9010355.1 hypothetical protein FRB93_004194 [Tulasnella sp. JGI-2019a]KAG9038647.1 hypothetical protein FRB95_000236 [Tulasnella sp. JGI-2019a]